MRKFASALAVFGIAALALGTATTANAITNGNIVTFGDSYFANPTVEDYFIAKAPAEIPGLPKVEQKNGCAHDPHGIPAKIAQKTGRQVDDYSCAGAVLYMPEDNNLDRQIDAAIADGALNDNTAFVPIQIGFNDTYQNAVNLPQVRQALWKFASDSAVEKIHAHAPNAVIGFVNYPTISHPGDSMQCLLHVTVNGQDIDAGVPAFWIEQGEIETSQYAQEAAERNGQVFIDIRSKTSDRHECAADDKRIVAGAIDTRTQDYNLPVHLNGDGKEIVASIIADAIANA